MSRRSPTHEMDVAERRGRERRLWRNALLVSAVLHLLVFLVWRHEPVPLSPFAAAGPRAGDDRAAGGSMQDVNLRTPPRRPLVPPPVPTPTLENVEPVEFDEEPSFEPAAVAGDLQGLEAPGLEDGTGEGDGGTAEEGRYRLSPPSPRGMIIPPTNKSLKGKEVEVWVFVNERGRVVPDSTVLRPPTSDEDFNERLMEEAAEWVFEPAMKGGQPVAAWFPYRISM